MKKFITVLLFLTLGLFVSGVDSCNKAGVGIPTVLVAPGSIAKIPVYLANGDECRGMQTDVCIDGGHLTLVGCENTDRTKGWYVGCNEYMPGCSRALVVSFQRDTLAQGHGAVVSLLYDVAKDAPPGECFNIVVMNSKVANMNNDYMEIDNEAGMGVCIE